MTKWATIPTIKKMEESDNQMANIELVIKIPEEEYKFAKKHNLYIETDADVIFRIERCLKSIAFGIPLPKEHGRLIDADKFIKNESYCGYIEDMDIDYFKQNTPTIIEADTKSEKCDTCYHNETEFSICQYCTGGNKYEERYTERKDNNE